MTWASSVVAAALLTATAACGVSAAPSFNVVSEASVRTVAAHTARMRMTASAVGTTFVASGSVDFRASAADLTSQSPLWGGGRLVVVGDYIYSQSRSGTWVRRRYKFDQLRNTLMDALTAPDPSRLFDAIRSVSTSFRSAGQEDLHGEPATHYIADVPAKAYFGFNLRDDPTIPVELWISNGLVVRITYVAIGITITNDFYDFGAPPSITPPSTFVDAPPPPG